MRGRRASDVAAGVEVDLGAEWGLCALDAVGWWRARLCKGWLDLRCGIVMQWSGLRIDSSIVEMEVETLLSLLQNDGVSQQEGPRQRYLGLETWTGG